MTTTTTPEMPRATARLQLHRDFTFDDALAQLPYLAQLGISHIYTSPILTARADSLHGYDVIDHGTVSAELGGEDGLRRLVSGLRDRGMGLVVDIVPNHMAVGGSDNRLWLDVLEWGRASRYADFFDIDWDVPDPALNQRVLAPFLGKPYGEALIDGSLTLCFDRDDGRFFAQYFTHRFPLAPRVYAPLLRAGAAPLARFSPSFRDAAKLKLNTRGGTFELARAELARAVVDSPTVTAALDDLLARFDPASTDGRDRLHRLLERCHFRLAWWRAAADEINWRRFFDVIELAGVRVERPAAFEIVHATTLRLYAEGLIDGVRIDHVDGLADPRTYCRRLRKRLAELSHLRPANAPKGRAYLVVEKILAPNEPLARDWQTDGTTGYSFMNDVGALLHDPGGEVSLTDLWVRFSGRWPDFRDEELRARRRIPLELLAADFNGSARALHRIARSDPLTRDWSLGAVQRILSEILVYFPVYRTYADARGRSDEDTALMARVVADAGARCLPAELPLLKLIDGWLGREAPNRCGSVARQLRLYAIARFQQLTSPAAAKSVEDTAFYRHGRLLSRSEVGSDPGRFSLSIQEFHLKAGSRARHFPHALLATATHDHKRGEDLRARLAVLSEVTERWDVLAQRWRARNARFKTVLDGTEAVRAAINDADAADQGAPDGADEYMLYQMIIGAWPHSLAVTDADGIADLRDRLQGWMLKALREAKRHSNWVEPNLQYEAACQRFLDAILDAQRAADFLADATELVSAIATAGAVNSLSQTLLKLTAPGIPDFYQGTEWWDFSLVDPDNRRPVDYPARAQALNAATTDAELFRSWRDGRIKQSLMQRVLGARAIRPELFTTGRYVPLRVIGPLSHHLIAFARHHDGHWLLVVAILRPAALLYPDATEPRVAAQFWDATSIVLPRDARNRDWRSILGGTGDIHIDSGVNVAALLCLWPAAILETDQSAT